MTASLHIPGASLQATELAALRRTAQDAFGPWHPGTLPGAVLVADFRPSMLRGQLRAFRSVAAAEALALIGWRVCLDGGWVALLALGAGAPVLISPAYGAEGMARVIDGLVQAHDLAEGLALAGQFEDPPLTQALCALDGFASPGAALVIASGFEIPGKGLSARIEALSRAHLLRLLHVTDGADPECPPARGLLALDANLPPEHTAAYLSRALQSVPGGRCI